MVKFSRLKKKSQNIKILSYKYHVLCKHTSGHNLMSCTYKIFPQIANKKKYSKEMEREKQKKKEKRPRSPESFFLYFFTAELSNMIEKNTPIPLQLFSILSKPRLECQLLYSVAVSIVF